MTIPRNDTLMVFTGKSKETMARQGGCGHWKLDPDRAARMRYLVATRNLHADWSEPGAEHGAGFLIATIGGVVPADDDRWLIQLREYAEINIPGLWPHQRRNPVTYTRLDAIGIEPNEQDWHDFAELQRSVRGGAVDAMAADEVRPLSFEQARQGLALAIGVRPEQIEITVRA